MPHQPLCTTCSCPLRIHCKVTPQTSGLGTSACVTNANGRIARAVPNNIINYFFTSGSVDVIAAFSAEIAALYTSGRSCWITLESAIFGMMSIIAMVLEDGTNITRLKDTKKIPSVRWNHGRSNATKDSAPPRSSA